VQRHATSKIASLDDLFSIRTLGFRGEALPSIASVSHFTLTTRPRDASEGTRIRIDGGTPAPTEPCGAAPGTSVEVRDLFYNVPARLKFLKAKATEGAHVAAVCLRAVLAHPHVTLRLTRDGRTALELLRADSLDVRARAVFPDEPLTLHEGTFEGVSVQAWLGAPERARSGASHLHLVINGRPVRDTALARAVAYAYGSVLAPGRFPAGVVLLELDPGEVDFNVHPQKLEVKLRRGRNVLDALTRRVERRHARRELLGTAAWQRARCIRPTRPECRFRRMGTGGTAYARGGGRQSLACARRYEHGHVLDRAAGILQCASAARASAAHVLDL
jgi:DNA mismatch repair protein MutL